MTDKPIADKIKVQTELMAHMKTFKEICDKLMIMNFIANNLVHKLKGSIVQQGDNTITIDSELYVSCISEIVYSPDSDTFFIYVPNKKLGIVLHNELVEYNPSLEIGCDTMGDTMVIELKYNKREFFTTHIKGNITDIVSLNLHNKN